MPIAEAYSGSASIGSTEYSFTNASTTLATQTTDGVYQLVVNASAMGSGDTYRFRVYEKCRSASSQRVLYEISLSGAQTEDLILPAITLIHGWDMSAMKTAGTDRTIEFSIRQLT